MNCFTSRITLIGLLLISLVCLNFSFKYKVQTKEVVSYKIFAIKFGERTHKVALKEVAIGTKSTDSTMVYFMYWLIKGSDGKIILVDAGFSDDIEINPRYITHQNPSKMLAKLNISPNEISDIIITHPHWDHIGGIDLFPNAMVWIQEKDFDYFIGKAWQKNGISNGFNEKDVLKVVKRNLNRKLTLVHGDGIELFHNIWVFTGSKHTFESQFVLVESNSNRVIIASDNSWFYHNLDSSLSIPITLDSVAYINNLKRMKLMVKNTNFIIPGHDPLVFTKFKHVSEDVVQILN